MADQALDTAGGSRLPRALTILLGLAAAVVAILGAPNAGKSTLLNRLTGAKLSIVTPKAQTTRFRVLGILMRGPSQILLVDTPGIFRPRRKLDRAMVKAAWTGAEDADLTLLLVDAKAGATEGVLTIAVKCAVTCSYPACEVRFVASVGNEVDRGFTRGDVMRLGG